MVFFCKCDIGEGDYIVWEEIPKARETTLLVSFLICRTTLISNNKLY
jgi:hypothetical protein